MWFWHAGHPLIVRFAADGEIRDSLLGGDVHAGEHPQAHVPSGAWQSARTTAGWALVSCVVAPAFSFDRFELAPPGWSPA